MTSPDRWDVLDELSSLTVPEPAYDERLRAWVIADPEQIRALARSPDVSAARSRSFLARLPDEFRDRVPNLVGFREQLLLFRDGEDHRALRAKTAALLTARLAIVENQVDSLWRDAWLSASDAPRFEAVELVLVPAVTQTMAMLLNCPGEIAASLRGWSESFNRSMSGNAGAPEFEAAEAALGELAALVSRYGQEEAVGSWVEELFESGKPTFSWAERRQTLLLLMLAGFDTSISMLANCLLPLLKREDALDKPTSTYGSEHAVQRACPVKFTMREIVKPLQIGEQEIPEGERILLSWYGGNIRLESDGALARGGFAFGFGTHACLGKSVAMHQLQACLAGLQLVQKRLVLDGEEQFNQNLCFLYPIELPVRWV
jgi:cytochrome P450